ncbi:hypothetical protein JOM56_015367 [Amanita muscaria]
MFAYAAMHSKCPIHLRALIPLQVPVLGANMSRRLRLAIQNAPKAHSDSAHPFLGHLVAPARRPLLQTDPAFQTCFNPADKELYDLWAPKRYWSKLRYVCMYPSFTS